MLPFKEIHDINHYKFLSLRLSPVVTSNSSYSTAYAYNLSYYISDIKHGAHVNLTIKPNKNS